MSNENVNNPEVVREALTDMPVWQKRPTTNDFGLMDEWDRKRRIERQAARQWLALLEFFLGEGE